MRHNLQLIKLPFGTNAQAKLCVYIKTRILLESFLNQNFFFLALEDTTSSFKNFKWQHLHMEKMSGVTKKLIILNL